MQHTDLYETLNSELLDIFNPQNLEVIPARDPSWVGPLPGDVVLTKEQRANGLKHCAELREQLSEDRAVNRRKKSTRLEQRLNILRGVQNG
ncbi:hypothetical protein [Celerinatantimonas sp. YJH-8]|uniref:hypothetical protein n=1 Tax=Celerinatantimonas sp. YJH-8 TaxID=3228714 RepID=UPI0038CA3FD7